MPFFKRAKWGTFGRNNFTFRRVNTIFPSKDETSQGKMRILKRIEAF